MSYISSNVPSSPSKFRRVNEPTATLAPTKDDARAELRTMAHKKVYVSDVDSFFENFFPPNASTSKKAVPNIFKGAPTTFTSEKAMYKWLCDRLNNSGQFKGKVFVNTGYKPDPNDDTRQAIDCGMYLSETAPAIGFTALGEESRRNIWSALELGMECKVHDSADPLPGDGNSEPTTEGGKSVWAQLLSYAALVFKFQKRLFHYIVIFFGKYSRILRFDHSGIVATEKIDYTTEEGGARLTQFFVRYCRFQAKNRGHDPTAIRINGKDFKAKDKEEGLAELAAEMRKYGQEVSELLPKDHVPPLFNKTLDEQWPWWRLEVYDEVTESCHYFAVGKPHFYAGGVVGRGTCGYIAVPLDENNKPTPLRIRKDGKTTLLNKDDDSAPLDADNEKSKDVYFVYLKDAWRVDHPGIEQEGAVLLALNRKEVQYVPTLVFHGDLDQDTASYNNWSVYHPEEDPQDCPLKAHQHYRLVVAEVGKPLSEFRNGMELVMAILCCVIAHKEACQAGYIHRDISAGNILLYPNGNGGFVGLLNDWELSRGTWQFTSVHALVDPGKVIMIPDDLESLFHVLLYFAIRFIPHNCVTAIAELLVNYFDDYTDGAEGQTSGQMKYHAMHNGEIDITLIANRKPKDVLRFYIPMKPEEHNAGAAKPMKLHPLNALIAELLGWFKALYALDEAKQEDAEDMADDPPSAETPLFLPKSKSSVSSNPQPSTSASAAPSASSATPAGDTHLLAVAAKLQSHDAMEELLSRYLTQKKWPSRDKVADMKPKKGYTPPKDNIPATSTKMSSKRALEGAPESTSKRIRSKARA
ncbi:hypothetical protein V8D89_003300 [Ganoderma adspersum]